MRSKISLKYGYTLVFYKEDNTLYLKVVTEDDILEFDGENGDLMIASDFESHLSAKEEVRLTLDEYISAARSFFTDWGVDADVTEAIIRDLTPWFKMFAVDG